MQRLKPKLFSVMKTYNKQQFMQDVIAGIIVGIIAIPLSIALAIASGVSPEKGIHTAIIAGFFISFLGGSRVQIGGPTGAFVVIVYGIVTKYGIEGLIISTLRAGIMLIVMGILRFGRLIKYIPYPITTGFTSGIAVVIFSGQIKDFLGLSIEKSAPGFIEKWVEYFQCLHTLNGQAAILGLISLLIVFFWPKINHKIPGSLVAIIVATIMAQGLHLDVETIGSRFGELSASFPKPHIPYLSIDTIRQLLPPAFTIAILAGIESLLSAVVSDGMIGNKHRPNMELVAQGVANFFSGLFGGIPATGAIARTAANVKNGGRTPIAGMVHTITVLLIMIVFMPYAKLIPLTTLAAILIYVSYNMSDIQTFINLLKAPKSDVLVLFITFFLTVVFDLVIAIEIGMVIATISFMKRMADATDIRKLTDELSDDEDDLQLLMLKDVYDGISVYEINGPFFFGAADRFRLVTEQAEKKITSTNS